MATVTLDGVRKSYERRGGRQRGLRAARNARCGIILQSPGAISSTVFRRREAMLSTILRLFVGMTTTAKCHPARSWFLGIPASAVRKTSNPSRSAAVSNAPSCRDRHDMCMTVRTSWPGNMWRSWTGRHSSIRTRSSRRGLDDFIRGKREDRQNVFPPEARPRLQNLVEAQSIGQVVEQDRHGHACSTEAWRSAHDFGIGRDQIGCFHEWFCLDAYRH